MTSETENRIRAIITGQDGNKPQPFMHFYEARAHIDVAEANEQLQWWVYVRARDAFGDESQQAQDAYALYVGLDAPRAVAVNRMMVTPSARKKDLRLKRRYQAFYGGSPVWDALIEADAARLVARRAKREAKREAKRKARENG